MKKQIIVFTIIAIVVVMGFGAYTISQNSSQSDSLIKKDEVIIPKDDNAKSTDSMMQKDDGKMTRSSGYVEYTKAALDQAAGGRRVLFFYANWCPTCRPTDADLSSNKSKLPEDLTVIRVNYNDTDTDQDEKDLAKKYGVTYQHTFVQIDGQGNEITKWNGGQTTEILTNIK